MKRLKILFSLIFMISVTAVAVLFGVESVTFKKASADDGVATYVYSPDDYYQYYKLSNPKHVFENDEYVVFIEADHPITVYNKNTASYKTYDEDFLVGTGENNSLDLGQAIVYTSSDNTDFLIYQNKLILYAINMETDTKLPIKDIGGNPISSNHFDYNGEYFAVSAQTSLDIYTLSIDSAKIELRPTAFHKTAPNSTKPSLIALNAQFFFYNDGTSIHSVSLTDLKEDRVVDVNAVRESGFDSFEYFLADNEKFYFIANNNVYFIEISNMQVPEAPVILNTAFNGLGDVNDPISLSLYNGNLLVVDNSSNTIQEFDTVNFKFTGKAVATTEPADNRISADSKGVDLYHNKLATLSSDKVKIINTKTKAFFELPFDATYNMITVGSSALAVANESTIRFATLSNANNKTTWEWSDPILTNESIGNIYACDYQNESFYFLSLKGTDPLITTYSENDLSVVTTKAVTVSQGFIAPGNLLTVDLDGNAYIYNNTDSSIKKFATNDDGKYSEVAFNNAYANQSLGLATDLYGNVYSLSPSNTVYKIDANTGEVSSYAINVSENLTVYAGVTTNATAFALNYDSKDVYFIFGGQSFILRTDGLDNKSIDDIKIPESLILSGEEGDSSVKKVTVTGKNAFKVEIPKADKSAKSALAFNYIEKNFATDKEYLVIGEAENFNILLADEIILVRKSDVPSVENRVGVSATDVKKTYVSTKVNLYYYPVISAENSYCVRKSDAVIRFDVGQELKVLSELTLNGKVFYYIETTFNEATVKGFVPVNFLSETLTEFEVHNNMTYKSVYADTVVYADDLTTEIYRFTSDTEIRAFSSNNGYTFIAFTADGVEYVGYVKDDAIIAKKDNALRNAVLIIVTAIALAATSIYLIHKKKVYKTVDED